MKKLTALLISCLFLCAVLTTGCADTKTICFDNGECIRAQPCGLFDCDEMDPRVSYEVSAGDIVLSIIFIETIVVPVLLLGWHCKEATGPRSFKRP